jgi:general secretion pathway protein H
MRAEPAAQPTSRMSSTDRKSGFTLIEVMAVMLIIALIGSLVVTITPGSGRAKLKALTLQTAALLRRERLGAIMTGQNRQVSLDEERRAVVGDGGDLILVPPDIAIDVLGANESWSGRLLLARFHPDGASSGAVLRFSREGAGYEVRVNWYTGGVTVVAP